jgi:hypothetical protein
MTPSPTARLAFCLVTLALVADAHAALPRERRFFSARHGVGVEAPPGWTISQHTGYPSILVVLLHPNGSRISVSAAPTPSKDARALVEQNRRGLEAQKLTVTRQSPGPRGGLIVDARATDRDEVVRQFYLVRPFGDDGTRQAVVLTLVTRPAQLTDAAAGFDWALGHLELEGPPGHGERSSPDAGARPDPGARDASAGERAADKERR